MKNKLKPSDTEQLNKLLKRYQALNFVLELLETESEIPIGGTNGEVLRSEDIVLNRLTSYDDSNSIVFEIEQPIVKYDKISKNYITIDGRRIFTAHKLIQLLFTNNPPIIEKYKKYKLKSMLNKI